MEQEAVVKQGRTANEEIVEILLEKDELSWKNIIYELVQTEQMNPWDIDVSKLAERFLDMIQTLHEMDFRITGKIVLAAAMLLKIKSTQLVEEDLTALDDLIESSEEPIDLLEELPQPFDYMEEEKAEKEAPDLVPRTPQPRQRKVHVDDLVGALDKALQAEMKRIQRQPAEPDQEVEVEDVDISKVIRDVYDRIYSHYQDNEEDLTFHGLIPDDAEKEDKVFTFMPLLHLDNQRNIDLRQESSFEEIFIKFLKELDDNFEVEEGDLGTV